MIQQPPGADLKRIHGALEDPDVIEGFQVVDGWASSHHQVRSTFGTEIIKYHFEGLPASARWLVVSVRERAVYVDFSRLKGFPPFVGKSRARMMREMRRSGIVQVSEDGIQHAKASLSDLTDELERKVFLWRLDLVSDVVRRYESSE